MRALIVALTPKLARIRDTIAKLLFFITGLVSFALMLGLGLVGFAKLFVSIVHFARSTIGEYGGNISSGAESTAVAIALEGLECLFLAPLAFLLFRGIADFLGDVIRANADEASACFLLRVKALILGLMAAVVATDLLKRALEKNGLTYEPALMGAALIIILAGYSLCIEWTAARYCKPPTER